MLSLTLSVFANSAFSHTLYLRSRLSPHAPCCLHAVSICLLANVLACLFPGSPMCLFTGRNSYTDAVHDLHASMSITRAQPPDELCAVCLEPLAQGADRLRGSPRCSHFFHAACVQAWQDEKKTCPTCRASPPGTLPPSTCLVGDSDDEPRTVREGLRTVRWFTWLTLLLTPWPRSPGRGADNRGAGNGGAEEWNAARGIGDWRARMERIYAAEAAAEVAGSNDDDDDDDDDAEEHDEDAEDDDAEDEDDDEAAATAPLPPTKAHVGPVVSLS